MNDLLELLRAATQAKIDYWDANLQLEQALCEHLNIEHIPDQVADEIDEQLSTLAAGRGHDRDQVAPQHVDDLLRKVRGAVPADWPPYMEDEV